MADFDLNFDLARFKELSKKSLSDKPVIRNDHGEEIFTISLALSAAVKKVFFERSELKFSAEPVIEKKPIVQFVNRMRIDAMEKFNKTTFLSCVYYYKDQVTFQKHIPVGVLIVYIERKYVPEMLRLFKYPYIDYDNDDEVLDGIGAISNLIAGYYKKELARLGYIDLEMSPFKSAINTVLDGVDYPKNQTEKFELSFDIEDQKRMVVEVVMDILPKVEVEE